MPSSPMQPSPWLHGCLKAQLSFRPTAYRAHRHSPWVIGYGHTAGVKPGDTCTMEQAEQWLHADIAAAGDIVSGADVDQGGLDVAVALLVAGL